jgi:hypothetical protein
MNNNTPGVCNRSLMWKSAILVISIFIILTGSDKGVIPSHACFFDLVSTLFSHVQYQNIHYLLGSAEEETDKH